VYQSFWTLTANPHVLSNDAVKALASTYTCTGPQVFFRYLTQVGIVPLTGTQSAIHMREDLSIFDCELAESECATMAILF
jgi:diketogulonate reductase-like aldo/keto reductase